MIRSLFGFHLGSNAGYAISSYERILYKVAVELASGDSSGVHFSYTDFKRGRSTTFPEGFNNFVEFDFNNLTPQVIARVAQYVRENKIDVACFFDMDATHPAVKVLKAAGVKKVISIWGAPVSGIMPFWRLLIKKIQVALSDSKLDFMIFESNPMLRTATHGRGYPASQVAIIRQGVDIQKFRPNLESDYVYKAFNFPTDRKVIIYTGHMEERKGPRILVKAAIELLYKRGRKDVAFLFCGNKNAEANPYQKLFEGLGLDELIQFGGYRNDLSDIYPSCFAGVIPSTGWDSFPYGAIEMQACGLPMIASNLQGLAESVLDGVTGLLFEPGNHLELADKIEILLDNRESARKFSHAGRKRCEDELNVETQFKKTFELIKNLLKN